jgi:hypothetical protein
MLRWESDTRDAECLDSTSAEIPTSKKRIRDLACT